jgi:hypothetical protein
MDQETLQMVCFFAAIPIVLSALFVLGVQAKGRARQRAWDRLRRPSEEEKALARKQREEWKQDWRGFKDAFLKAYRGESEK